MTTSTSKYATRAARSVFFAPALVSADGGLLTPLLLSRSSASGTSASTALRYPTRTIWYVNRAYHNCDSPPPYHLALKSARTAKPNHTRSTTLCTCSSRYIGPWTSQVHWSRNSPLSQFCTWGMIDIHCAILLRRLTLGWSHRYRDPAGPTPGSPAADISGDPAGV